MAEHPNAALVRSAYEAFAAGDMDTIAKVFADDIVWHIAGRNELSGDYRGQGEVFGFFGRLAELSGGTFELDMHDLLATDGHVVALVRERGSRAGRSIDSNGVHVWHVADGRAVEFWGFNYDQYADDEFWSARPGGA